MDQIAKFVREPRVRELGFLVALIYFCQGSNIILTLAMHDTLVSAIGLSFVHFVIDELGIWAAAASSIAAWLVVYKHKAEQYSAPMAVWIVLHILTFSWLVSIALLGNIVVACSIAMVLVLCTIDTLVVFNRINKWAGRLMYPFLAWTIAVFAVTLMSFS